VNTAALAPYFVVTALLAVTMSARADGPGAFRAPDRSVAPISQADAIEAYNAGYAAIQRAEHAENLAAAATSEQDRKTALKSAQDAYKASLDSFAAATRADPSMHEAHTYIGYANRKLGRYDAALVAYDEALRINPDYPHAIEYQGEAFLALNRIDAARFNYLRLYALDRGQAHKLLQAMRAWLALHLDKPPRGVDMEGFAAWIAGRSTSADTHPPDAGSKW
jgi:tetratricopeptide (TPR) repeat protein